MKKLNFIFLISFAILLIAGCSKFETDPEFLNVNDDVTLKKGKIHPVPFKAEFDIWSVFFEENGSVIHQDFSGTGNATHLGKTTIYADEIINIAVSPWTDEVSYTLTAANGDTLYFEYTSEITETGFPFLTAVGSGYFNGGTGRFENASGTANFTATFHVYDNIGHSVFTGNIMY